MNNDTSPPSFGDVIVSLREDFLKAIVRLPKPMRDREIEVTTIHQYTPLRTLVDMLTAYEDAVPREVWATSAPYMNDTQEFEHARSLFKKALDKVQATSAASVSGDVFDFLRERVEKANGRGVFCACYSAKGDDLNQWRGYADGGKGACVSFDLVNMQEAFPAYSGWVRYDPEAQRRLVEEIATEIAMAFHRLTGEGPAEAVPAAAYESLNLFLPLVFAFLKHPKFEEEAEFRIVFLNDPDEGGLKVFFRADGSRIVPYVKLTIRKGDVPIALPMTGVTFAPGAKGENNRMAVWGMLTQRKITGIAITESEIPFLPTS